LASVTKVTATVTALMKLYDMKKWKLSDKISNFIPETDATDLKDITMKELLLHESGLLSSIPFYSDAIDTEKLDGKLFSTRKTATHTIKIGDKLFINKTAEYRKDVFANEHDLVFSIPVAKDLYMNYNFLDTMFCKILKSKVKPGNKYLYSDINFILLQRIVENLYQETLDNVVENEFYNPMGASSLCFNPWRTISLNQIAPTEDDIFFRFQLLQGYVHDQTAAMMGGVAGQAGLFGNANDIAKLLQMFLNKGEYGGQRYISAETVNLFTSTQSQITKRGLGFDKYDSEKNSYSAYSSASAYGHTGFTGTMIWVDPEYELVYIFLSNRIHPEQYNTKLSELSVRSKILDIIYRAITILDNTDDTKKL
jgi:CubicO group peptidase (beta-lactamase class C family)